VVSRWAASPTSGASQHSPSPFVMRSGRLTLGWIRQLALTDRLIPSSSCSATQSPFGRPEAIGASWETGSRWLQRESLTGGSGSYLRDPFCLGEVSASASSTIMLPWGWSPRAHRSSLLLVASSPEHKELKLGAWGLHLPAFN
jgi:hypothetical protein